MTYQRSVQMLEAAAEGILRVAVGLYAQAAAAAATAVALQQACDRLKGLDEERPPAAPLADAGDPRP